MRQRLSSRYKLIFLDVIAILVVLVSAIVYGKNNLNTDGDNIRINYVCTVSASEGKMLTEDFYTPITINRDGSYIVRAQWDSSEDIEIVSGLLLKDDRNEQKFLATGDIVSAESIPLTLGKGEYVLEYNYFANEEDFYSYIKTNEDGPIIRDKGAFSADGDWDLNVQVSIERTLAKEITVILTFATILGILIGLLIRLLVKEGNKASSEYDERQELLRGRAYKWGYIFLGSYVGILAFLSFVGISLPADNSLLLIIGLIIAMCIVETIAILNDCYFALNDNKTSIMVSFVVLMIINGMIAIYDILTGMAWADGILKIGSLNVFIEIELIYLLILIIIKTHKDGKEEE